MIREQVIPFLLSVIESGESLSAQDLADIKQARTSAEPEGLREAWRDVMGLLGDHGPDKTRTLPKPTEALWRMRDAYDPYRATICEHPEADAFVSEEEEPTE